MNPKREHRGSTRLTVYLAAELLVEGAASSPAITKDVGAEGLLVLTRARLVVGQSVRLRVYPPGGDDRHLEITGRVLRREPLAFDERGTWREKVALAFDEPQHQLAQQFAALVADQCRAFRAER